MDLAPAAIGSPHLVFLTSEARAAGYGKREIAALLRAGVWSRVRHGAYTDGPTWRSASEVERHGLRARAVLKQARTDVLLSHASAAVLLGCPTYGLDLANVHVTRLDRHAGRREAGVRQHRGLLLAEDQASYNGLPVTSATKTALDVTTLADTESALCVVNHLLHTGATTLPDLGQRYQRMAHDPHTLRTDLVLRLADPRLESVGESRTFFLCWWHGLPCPEPQYVVRDGDGQIIARLDFAWPELKAWAEFDGRVKYVGDAQDASDAVFREKRREDRVRELTGWRCLRLTWADLHDPARTAARIEAFLFGATAA